MYPPRQYFKILNPIRKPLFDGLSGYLKGLFDTQELVKRELMSEGEELEFDTSGYTQGEGKDAWYDAYFSVAVSGRTPTKALFSFIVDCFNETTHEFYVIGEPGSGALDQSSGHSQKSSHQP